VNDSACLVDTNVWIALTFDSHPGHQAATAAIAAATENRPAVFCRATQQSFLRLVSTPALTRQYGAGGMTNDDALELLDRFMAAPIVAYQDEPAGLFPLWRSLAARPTAGPRVWMDAYLAAFAIAGGLQIMTLDHDFMSFAHAGLDLLIL
jgi:toxin-antitoxin system PIN domain toxin